MTVIAYDSAQLQYMIQHRTVRIIFRIILQTNITAQMMCLLEGKGTINKDNIQSYHSMHS